MNSIAAIPSDSAAGGFGQNRPNVRRFPRSALSAACRPPGRRFSSWPPRSMKQLTGLVVCEGCDAVYRRPELRSREVARCLRCGTELARHPKPALRAQGGTVGWVRTTDLRIHNPAL